MRIQAALVLGGLCALGGGCSPMANARRAAPSERAAVAPPAAKIDDKQADKLATTAWGQWGQASPEITYSADYSAGFKSGFADYLQGKSDGEPPTVPPSSYGPGAYESVQGRQAVLEWFRGFREGATQARGSGLRPDPTAAINLPSLPPATSSPVRRVHEITAAEILVLPVVMITASGISWGEGEEPAQATARAPR